MEYDKPEIADVWEVYGTVQCKVSPLRSHIPSDQLALQNGYVRLCIGNNNFGICHL